MVRWLRRGAPSHRLAQEVSSASSRVGAALAQSGHQHLSGARGDGQQRVIAPLARVVVALRALLGQPKRLAEGGVQVDGQRIIAGTRPSGPGPSQQLPAHPIQLAHVAPPEAAQEGSQRGRRLDYTAQHPIGSPCAQRVGVGDAVATGQCRRHQGQELVSRVGTARRTAQVNVVVHQLAQSQMMGQSDRKDQPSIGHQAVVIEGDLDAVGLLT